MARQNFTGGFFRRQFFSPTNVILFTVGLVALFIANRTITGRMFTKGTA